MKICIALITFVAFGAFAESWIHPDKITFHSKNKIFELTIYAANRNVYYFTYFDSALYLKEAELNKNYCYGELKENKGNSSRLIWQKNMACYYSPNALISDDGLNVVTLDDRYNEKYLIVGYDQSGFLKWSIDSVYEVISPSEFAKIQPNFFYVPWMGNYELTKQQLILRMKIPPLMNATKEKPDHAYYNWVASGEPETVRRIDLDSGNLLDKPVVTKKYDFPKFECANGLFKRQWLVWDHLEYSCSLSKYPVAPNLKVELEGEYKRYLYNYESSQWRLILRGQYKNNKRDGEWINWGLGSDNCSQRYKDGVVVNEESSGVTGKLFCDFD